MSIRSSLLKEHVNKYAMLGVVIAIGSIFFASLLVSYQMTGGIHLSGFILAQTSNPAIWALDLTPFAFAYWGQSFCYGLASKAESIIEDKTREYVIKRDDLALKLKYESQHDHLTNLPNSRLLSQRIKQGIQQINDNEHLVVILISIKRFRDINYEFGNFSANSLLIQFAEKLKSILLEPYMLQAYMGMNMVARLYGAEFAVLIPRLRKEHHLMQMIEKILEQTSINFMIDGHSIDVYTTVGIAIYPKHGKTEESLLHHATLSLLYAEKENKSYAIYDQSMADQDKSRRLMLKALNNAVEQGNVRLRYKPVHELKTNKVVGCDAMVQVENLQRDQGIEIDKLLPLLENFSLVKKLTDKVLKQAISQLAAWQKSLNQDLFISIHLFNAMDIELPKTLETLLKRYKVSAGCIKIALTEKACLSEQTRSIHILKQIAALGIRITISDFGSGYTSFVYLINFPIDEITIEHSFTMHMMHDEKKYRLVKSIIKLAETLTLNVSADGILDDACKNALIKLGCVYGGGPYASDPLSSEAFIHYLESRS